MKALVLFGVFIVGVLVGVLVFGGHLHAGPTGAATQNCFIDNQPCACISMTCTCGNQTIPASYCKQSLPA